MIEIYVSNAPITCTKSLCLSGFIYKDYMLNWSFVFLWKLDTDIRKDWLAQANSFIVCCLELTFVLKLTLGGKYRRKLCNRYRTHIMKTPFKTPLSKRLRLVVFCHIQYIAEKCEERTTTWIQNIHAELLFVSYMEPASFPPLPTSN